MSLRPGIAGFDLRRMRALLGSGDRAALARIVADVEQDPPFREPGRNASVASILERAILDGVPFPELDAEGEEHVSAAGRLAGYEQVLKWTDLSFWHLDALQETWNAIFRNYRDDRPTLVRFTPLHRLAAGRPLFGRKIVTDWSHYAYLSRAEVGALRAALREYEGADPPALRDDAARPFFEEFCGDLDGLIGAGRDLWFVAS